MTGWATEATPEAPARVVSGLAENPDSIFCDGHHGPRQQMDVRFCGMQEPSAERHRCAAAMNPEVTYTRALASTPGIPLPTLTSDLHGCRSLGPKPFCCSLARPGLSCRQSCQSRNRNKKDYLAQNVAAKLRSTIPAPLERNLRPICSSRSIEEMPIQTAPIPAVRLSTRTQNHAVTSMWMSSWWMASAGCAG